MEGSRGTRDGLGGKTNRYIFTLEEMCCVNERTEAVDVGNGWSNLVRYLGKVG